MTIISVMSTMTNMESTENICANILMRRVSFENDKKII